jgi:CysZ protein
LLSAAVAAAREILTPPFRRVFVQTLGLTVLLLGFAWLGLERLVGALVGFAAPWLQTVISVVTGVGLVVGLAFVVAPVSFVVAGFFFDVLAAKVEADMAPPEGIGQTPSPATAVRVATTFAGVALLANAVALLLLLVPGVNAVAFFGANAYLFGRGYFELAALRYRPRQEAEALRRRHGVEIFATGCLVALLATVPIVNLLTPLFGTALLVRVHANIVARERRQLSR